MATLRNFFKRTVGRRSSNPDHLSAVSINIDSTSDTSSSTHERSPSQTNDGYSSTSTLGVLTIGSDDSMRRPLLHVHAAKRKRTFFSRLINTSTTMDVQEEQALDESIGLIDKTLPKELILR